MVHFQKWFLQGLLRNQLVVLVLAHGLALEMLHCALPSTARLAIRHWVNLILLMNLDLILPMPLWLREAESLLNRITPAWAMAAVFSDGTRQALMPMMRDIL